MLERFNIYSSLLAVVFLLTVSGCASIAEFKRDDAKNPAIPCSLKPESLYFSNTQSDLIFATLPVSHLVFFKRCNSMAGFNCHRMGQVWLLAMPFAVVDLPLALVSDIRQLPADRSYSLTRDSCLAGDHRATGKPQ